MLLKFRQNTPNPRFNFVAGSPPKKEYFMGIIERNPIVSFSDIVTENTQVERRIRRLMTKGGAMPTLFYGGAGTGKSSLCQVIANELVGKGYEPDVEVINVSEFPTRAALCKKIRGIGGFALSNNLGKTVVILEELDGAGKPSQNALKAVMDKESVDKLFLATTNNLPDIIVPIRSRFLRIKINQSPPNRWLSRALAVLRNEGVVISKQDCLKLLKAHAKGEDGREIMRELDDYAHSYNTP